MNRREALTAMAFVPLAVNTSTLPVIQFSSMRSISNLKEIFKNSRWRFKDADTEVQEAIAWLPSDRAIEYIDGRKAFYGVVKVTRQRNMTDTPRRKAYIPNFPRIERMPETYEIDLEDNTLAWGYA